MTNESRLVLLTGATGYIGGRLVPRLLEAGYSIRCLVRESGRLQGRPWSDQVAVEEGDALQLETLPAAMKDVWAAYYLIHSLSNTKSNHDRDLVGARNFGQAAQEAGVERIICLGSLGHLMRLRAEMKMPGRAWLQLEARPQENGQTLFVQTAFMAPKRLPGLLYWYGLYPIHGVIFSGMISEIGARAEAMAGT